MSRPRTIDRDAVLDAAEHIVVTRGAAELTFDAVARTAGITKGGVQSCFGHKEGLVAAMLQRWNEDYERARTAAGKAHPASTPVERHVAVTATADALNARSAGLLAALLQSKDQLGWVRDWYAAHRAEMGTTDDGRRARLAFLACEGAFMLRHFGLMEMRDDEWAEVFHDIARCAKPANGGRA